MHPSSCLHPSIAVSSCFPVAPDIQRTLLHLYRPHKVSNLAKTASHSDTHGDRTNLISTCPRLPVLLLSMNSSVFESWMFMYESTLINRPLYSVWPHFNRTMTSSLTLPEVLVSPCFEIWDRCFVEAYRDCSIGRGLRGTNCQRPN